MTKHYFCEKCEKIVPKSEVVDLSQVFGNVLARLKTPKEDVMKPHLVHQYKITVNAYGSLPEGNIAYCPVEETITCGKVREPNEYEYFIYHTCKTNS